MTDKTIAQLADGGTLQVTDAIPVARSGGNVRAAVGTAGTKAASDATKPVVASVDGSVTVGHLAVYSDTAGTVEDGGEQGGFLLNATVLTPPVLTTDFVPIVRGGQVYLAAVSAVLAAQAPAGQGGQYDFSDPQNSAFAAII